VCVWGLQAINFGIIYGQSAFGLAKGLAIPVADAKKYIETYFVRYPGIQVYTRHAGVYPACRCISRLYIQLPVLGVHGRARGAEGGARAA
jgi:hypothetical protein